VATLLAYTIFSGLSGFSRTGVEFLVFRFLFGLGVGGMFGAATTLVAESVPKHFRTLALGLDAGAVGVRQHDRVGAEPEDHAGHGEFLGPVQRVAGAVVRERISGGAGAADGAVPEGAAGVDQGEGGGGRRGSAKRVGSIADLFRHPRWRKSTFIGICLGVAGMVGLWGIAFFSPELITTAFKNRPLQVKEVLKPMELCVGLKSSTSPAVAHLKAKLSLRCLGKWKQSTPERKCQPRPWRRWWRTSTA